MTDLVRAGVVLCSCKHQQDAKRMDASAVSSFLRSKRGDLPILTVDDLCERPSQLTSFVSDNGLESVVLAACADPEHVKELETASEDAGINRLSIENVGCSEVCTRLQETPRKSTEASKILVLAHLDKAIRAGLVRRAMVSFVEKKSMSRRDFVRRMRTMFMEYRQAPIVLEDVCSRHSKTCGYCLSSCKFNAIRKGVRSAEIIGESCVECGVCAGVCPVGAIQVPGFSDGQLAAMISAMTSNDVDVERRAVVVTCPLGITKLQREWAEGHGPEACVSLAVAPCIGTVGWSHLMLSSSLGVGLVAVCPDKSCRKAVALEPTRQNFSLMDKIWGTIHPAESLCTIVETEADASVARALNERLRLLPRFCGSEVAYKDENRRELLKSATLSLASTTKSGLETVWSGGASLFFNLKADPERCSLCGACVPGCPDKALRTTNESGSLFFTAALCVGCGICLKVCPADALRLEKSFSFANIVQGGHIELVRGEKISCTKCGKPVLQKKTIEAVSKVLQAKGSNVTPEALLLCSVCKTRHLPPVRRT